MHSLVRRVHRFIRDRRLIDQADRVAVGVSGGADSVALALILAELAPRAEWTLAGLVHVHHGIRPEADADADFVTALAGRLGLPLELIHVDVPALARAARRSIEAVAREARYRGFEEAVDRLPATVLATGHTMDDQAETVLLRLLRGAGARGVSGIRARRDRFVRPLLGCRRDELRGLLGARGEPFREDASNRDLSVPRNRLRHQLMPVVETLAPGGVTALSRFADLAVDDEAWLTDRAHEAYRAGVRSSRTGVQLNRAWLNALPPALARRVVREAIEQAGGVVTLRDVTALLALSRGARATGTLDLHRLVARCGADAVSIAPAAPDPAILMGEAVLPIPGRVVLGDGLAVRASRRQGGGLPGRDGGADRAVCEAASIEAPLMVRSRRPGDRLRPLGAPGRRKLQDVLVDRKVPRNLRDQVPVVVDARGRIVWVAGVVMAHECRVTRPEADMVILELEKSHQ